VLAPTKPSPLHSNEPSHSPHIIPDDNAAYQHISTNNNVSTSPHLIPPDDGIQNSVPIHRYPTRHKLSTPFQTVNHIKHQSLATFEQQFINLVTNPFTGKEENFNDLMKSSSQDVWTASYTRELGRCTNGVNNDGTGRNSFRFIRHGDVPPGVIPTYGKQHCTIRPNKPETHRTRLVVGGDKVSYDGPVTSPAAEQPLAKLIINSTLSTPNAKFGALDIKDMFLMTRFQSKKDYSYMRLAIKFIPQIIIDNYNLAPLVHNGYVYCEITGGMYGLPHAARLAWIKLHNLLTTNNYHESVSVPGLWTSSISDLAFVLIVDDFGIRYTNPKDLRHLESCLNQQYQTTLDLTGSKFLGFDLHWNYHKRTCVLSMPNYIPTLLKKLKFKQTKKTHSPFPYTPPSYTKIQYASQKDPSSLPQEKITYVQKVAGSLLYFAHSLDSLLLAGLNNIAIDISTADETTLANVNHMLNYVATNPNPMILFKRSNMILKAHSDASYLCAPKA